MSTSPNEPQILEASMKYSFSECSLEEYSPQRTLIFGGTMGNTPPTSTSLMTLGKEHESQTVAAADEEVNVVPNSTMEDDIGWLDWFNNVD